MNVIVNQIVLMLVRVIGMKKDVMLKNKLLFQIVIVVQIVVVNPLDVMGQI